MARITKKYRFDEPEAANGQRFQRHNRNHKIATSSMSKIKRRQGWGYAKRRALLYEE